ncbi:tetratricopeptide repeat protein, partial [Streptomyces anulatus]
MPDPVVAMAAMSDSGGQTLIAMYSPNGMVRFWDPTNRTLVPEPVKLEAPGTVAMTAIPGKRRALLATVNGRGAVQVWDSTNGRRVGGPFIIGGGDVLAMTSLPLPDGGTALAAADYVGTVRLVDPQYGKLLGQFTGARTFLGRAMTSFTSRDKRAILATADYSGTVRFWTLQGNKLSRHSMPSGISLNVRPAKVLAMTTFAGGRDGGDILVTVGYDRIVRLWDVESTTLNGPSLTEDGIGHDVPPRHTSAGKRNDSWSAIPLRNLTPQAAAGWPAAVLTGCEAATDTRRQRARVNPAAYVPDLATSLHNLSMRYGAVNRADEALAAEQEATEIRRELAQVNPAAHVP